MATRVVVTLDDDVYRRVQQLAERTGKPIDTVASVVLGLSLAELDSRPVQALSDSEIITLAESTMDAEQNAHFSDLQNRQQSGAITETERDKLNIMLAIYDAGQLRKTQALVEAVKRGLRAPLSA